MTKPLSLEEIIKECVEKDVSYLSGKEQIVVIDSYIYQIRQHIRQLAESMKKQGRYENIKRCMGKDGIIKEIETNIHYDEGEIQYNRALSDLLEKL